MKQPSPRKVRRRHTVQFHVRVDIAFKDAGSHVVACCPALDIFSQGKNRAEAKANLTEAIQLFIESCYQRKVLDDVLVEAGFMPTPDKPHEGGAPRKSLKGVNDDYLDVPLPLLMAQGVRANQSC